MSETLIYSLRKGATPPPADAVRVDRRSQWGNPFEMVNGTSAERDRVCDAFEEYAAARAAAEPDWLAPLRGRPLVCWCKMKPTSRVRCHAEALARLANEDLNA